MASEASDLIEEALNKAMQLNEDYEEGDIIIDWVLVSFAANPDVDKSNAYPTFFSNGEIPTYRARGLLTTALMHLGGDDG